MINNKKSGWIARLVFVLALVLTNWALPSRASSFDCEVCALCPEWPDLVPCCAPPGGGLGGNDDCHDDDDECHLHGNYCARLLTQ